MRSIQSAGCDFNQAAPHPADPIECHRARRERRHPTASHNRSGPEWPPLDPLENRIGPITALAGSSGARQKSVLWGFAMAALARLTKPILLTTQRHNFTCV